MTKLNIKTVEGTMIAIAALGTLFAPSATACGTRPGEAGLATSKLFAPLELQPPLSSAEAQTSSPGEQDQQGRRSERRRAPIVGMWTVDFYVGTSNQLYDRAIEQFYADGNEMTTDIAAAPATDNTCYGVWQQTANRVFKLKHFGWVFDNGTYAGQFELTETLHVGNPGDTVIGRYVADVRDLSGNKRKAVQDRLMEAIDRVYNGVARFSLKKPIPSTKLPNRALVVSNPIRPLFSA
jgi:hypothetical protein